jgi:hypothetical protein
VECALRGYTYSSAEESTGTAPTVSTSLIVEPGAVPIVRSHAYHLRARRKLNVCEREASSDMVPGGVVLVETQFVIKLPL